MRSGNILRTSNDSNLVVMFCEKSELWKFLLLLIYNVCSNAMLPSKKNFMRTYSVRSLGNQLLKKNRIKKKVKKIF